MTVHRRAQRVAIAAALALAAAAASPSARANGRFPAAGQIAVDPSDAKHLVLRTTYGILQTTDGGGSWEWICEGAVGYGGQEDPAMGVLADGSMIAGIFEGLSASHDLGCSWAFAPAPLAGFFTIDVAVDAKSPDHAVAITSAGDATGFHVVLAETLDDAKTWSQAGIAIPDDFEALTVDTAPSLPARVYVSGLYDNQLAAGIERSDDRGQTWTRLPFSLPAGAEPFIAAVDPTNPDRVYVRVNETSGDHLLVSTDGAQSWTEIAATSGEMLGFALSPDGARIAIGGPTDGVLVAAANDLVFAKTSALGAKCLRWETSGLYACADEFVDGMTAGVSQDGGKTFAPLYHLADLAPLECAAGTAVAGLCPAAWPAVQATLGIGQGGAGAGGATSSGAGGARAAGDSGSCAVSGGAGLDGGGPRRALAACALVLGACLRRRRTRPRGA